jgi:hypothetical protein
MIRLFEALLGSVSDRDKWSLMAGSVLRSVVVTSLQEIDPIVRDHVNNAMFFGEPS